MTTVLNDPAPQAALARTTAPREVRVALLGLGQVGTAIAEIAASHPDPSCRFAITSTLVRDLRRPRRLDVAGFGLTSDPFQPLASNPDVVIEVLGGLEPARTLLLAALEARLPVVTANKSLLAVHGDELFSAAHRAGVPLLYEASVLAGVPFLGTFRRRPLARSVSAVQGMWPLRWKCWRRGRGAEPGRSRALSEAVVTHVAGRAWRGLKTPPYNPGGVCGGCWGLFVGPGSSDPARARPPDPQTRKPANPRTREPRTADRG